MRWRSYRHRFLPWIILNWRKQFRENCSPDSTTLQAPFDVTKCRDELCAYLHHLDENLSKKLLESRESYPRTHLAASFSKQTRQHHSIGTQCALETLGFSIRRAQSKIKSAGTGVVVSEGRIPENHLVALYPGLIYQSGEPILLQSIANQFIFRCHDGVLLDGNDRAISKFLFRSCAGRDICGAHLMCDISWLTDQPINVLNIGQYVNNHNQEYPANVEYQEMNLSDDFPDELLKYIPNIHYSSYHQFGSTRERRIVVLRSVREIQTGEELFSTYFSFTS